MEQTFIILPYVDDLQLTSYCQKHLIIAIDII